MVCFQAVSCNQVSRLFNVAKLFSSTGMQVDFSSLVEMISGEMWIYFISRLASECCAM